MLKMVTGRRDGKGWGGYPATGARRNQPSSADLHTKNFSRVGFYGKKKENGYCGQQWKSLGTVGKSGINPGKTDRLMFRGIR